MIKAGDVALENIRELYNSILKTESMPKEWKNAFITLWKEIRPIKQIIAQTASFHIYTSCL